jgi:glycosyltransferase involved in cell wall biosynthesis
VRQVLCYPFVGDSVGGAHLSTIELIKHIDSERYRPLIVLHEEGLLADQLRRAGLDYVHLPLRAYAGARPSLVSIATSALRAAPTLRRFLRREGVSLVHCNDLRTNMTWALASRLAGACFVWHQRTQTLSDSLLWKTIPRLAHHCIAISATAARSFGGAGRRLSIIDNPFSIDATCERASARAALIAETGAAANDRLIGYVGRLVDAKRPEVCIDLLGELLRRGEPCVRLLLFGRGADAMTARLQARARRQGAEDRIHFMGFRHPVENAIAGMDILVAPSEQEGFGRTLIEAMLVGTPVLASDIDAHRETVAADVNGLLAPVGEVSIFADQARRLLQDEALAKRLASTAREMAQRRFSAQRHAQEVQSVYAALLADRA